MQRRVHLLSVPVLHTRGHYAMETVKANWPNIAAGKHNKSGSHTQGPQTAGGMGTATSSIALGACPALPVPCNPGRKGRTTFLTRSEPKSGGGTSFSRSICSASVKAGWGVGTAMVGPDGSSCVQQGLRRACIPWQPTLPTSCRRCLTYNRPQLHV